jgi:protein-disulfide isomerase
MASIASDRQGLTNRILGHVVLLLMCFLGPSFCLAGQSRQDELSTLQRDVKTLGEQQRQIIARLDELKRLVTANAAGRPQPAPPPSTLTIQGESFRGDAAAPVAIVEYADFECPYCGAYERSVFPQILSDYIETGKVKYFYRDLPLPIHPHAMIAARAARCAGEQGEYWEMHDNLFAKQAGFSDPALLDRAQTLGMDGGKFSECLSSNRYTDDIQKSMSEAHKMGIEGTPTFFLGTVGPNGDEVSIEKRVIGAVPYENFKAALDELLDSKGQQ